MFLDSEATDILLTFLHETAERRFPLVGVWRKPEGDAIDILADDKVDPAALFSARVADPSVDFAALEEVDLDDEQAVQEALAPVGESLRALNDELEAEYQQVKEDEGGSYMPLHDRAAYWGALAAGTTTTADAYALFPPELATLEQDLASGSTRHARLLVRLDVEFTSRRGQIRTHLEGRGLSFTRATPRARSAPAAASR